MGTVVGTFMLAGWLYPAVQHMQNMWFSSARLFVCACVYPHTVHVCVCVELVPNPPWHRLVLLLVFAQSFSISPLPLVPSYLPSLSCPVSPCSQSYHRGNRHAVPARKYLDHKQLFQFITAGSSQTL